MRRRTVIIPLLLIFATAIGLSLRNYHPEPEYQNHPLSYWLDYNPREEDHIADELRYKAIQTIGTNALPFYTAWASAKDSAPKKELIRLLALFNIHLRSAEGYQEMAETGWHTANLSREMLSPIVWETLSRFDVGVCGLITKEDEQDCCRRLLNGAPEVREGAAREMPEYFFNAPDSINTLTLALKDGSPRVRYFAARSLVLAKNYTNSQPAIPALIQSLQDTNEFVRMTAAFALGKFGKAAASAKTALLPLLKDSNTDVRACAKLALQQIDSDKIVIQAKK
ncbi:HEAT repeat domain-containing protein [Pedosphaera parvula]|uniref:HEAT domain containing protein n=1 Tax=Pedosphaera parvula (strain Ellin514) TaxID=320771 RepID=B9XLL8_PEDPL|nr:HEAT repeat domain-containing protein [Pedosphaera parvula]EEF59266.1 HEAT domain containing protein [Pedosphaera parvula Ellin514]